MLGEGAADLHLVRVDGEQELVQLARHKTVAKGGVRGRASAAPLQKLEGKDVSGEHTLLPGTLCGPA